ncbi:hypothetical protein FRC15_010889, partial [Serendipita sp. 397]
QRWSTKHLSNKTRALDYGQFLEANEAPKFRRTIGPSEVKSRIEANKIFLDDGEVRGPEVRVTNAFELPEHQ